MRQGIIIYVLILVNARYITTESTAGPTATTNTSDFTALTYQWLYPFPPAGCKDLSSKV